jgi:putative endonuclease
MTAGRVQTYRKGLWAESLGAAYLAVKGYRILARRYKTPVGEIDILAEKGGVIAAVEVKARDRMEDAMTAVTPHSRGRIERAALHYIAGHPQYAGRSIRFDVITIKLPFFIRHIDNAWRPRA